MNTNGEEINIYQTADGKAIIDIHTVTHIDAVEKAHCKYIAYRASVPDDLSDVTKVYLKFLLERQKKHIDGSAGKEEGA